MKSLDQLKNENSPFGTYGTHYFNLETGKIPHIADNVTINGSIDCIGQVTIEDDVFSGHDVMILTGGHDYMQFGNARKGSSASGDVYICQGVWLASRCMILGGVTIGKHSVIGAGSVVTRNVPAYQFWAGTPARFIKDIPHHD